MTQPTIVLANFDAKISAGIRSLCDEERVRLPHTDGQGCKIGSSFSRSCDIIFDRDHRWDGENP